MKKLTNYIKIISGGTPKTSVAKYWNGNIPWLTVKDFGVVNRFVFSTEKNITKLGLQNSSSNILQKNDIIISARGTVGKIALIGTSMAFNQSCYGLRVISSQLNQFYLYYWLKQNVEQLKTQSNGGVFDTIIRNSFENIIINIPDLNTQQHIVDTIGSIDDLIESNNHIFNKFNNFLQILLHKFILKSQVVIKLDKLIYKTGKLCKNQEWRQSKLIDLSSMPSDNVVINTFSDGALFNTNIKTLVENTLLYGSIRPYFHKCGFTTEINYVAGTVHSFKTYDSKYYYWILGVISSLNFHNHCNTKSQGTKMPIINWSSFVDYDVIIPNEINLTKFNNIIEPLFCDIKSKMIQNRKLIILKEILLKKFFG
ncbi:MAG: restriction endonuclease subunit S [Bacilli bacterium]